MQEDRHLRAKREAEGQNAGGWKPGVGNLLAIILCLLLVAAAVVLGVTTGIGLLFAVPLVGVIIVVALVLFRGRGAPREFVAPCPYCGASVSAAAHLAEVNCPSCGRHVEIRDRALLKAG